MKQNGARRFLLDAWIHFSHYSHFSAQNVCLPCVGARFLHLPLLVFRLRQEVNDLRCVGIDPE